MRDKATYRGNRRDVARKVAQDEHISMHEAFWKITNRLKSKFLSK